MNLKKLYNTMSFKIFAGLITVAIIPLFINVFLNNLLISRNYLKIEEKSMETKMISAKATFESNARQIGKLALDNGIGKDTYNEINNNNIQWFKKHFESLMKENKGLDLIIVADNNKYPICEYGIGQESYLELLNDEMVSKLINSRYNGNYHDTYGLKKVGDQLYYIGVAPILNEKLMGHTKGIIILGKKVTPQLLNDINNEFGLNIALSYNDKIITDSNKNKELIKKYTGTITLFNKNVAEFGNSDIIGKTPIWDINNRQIGYLYLIESREFFLSTLDGIFRNNIVALLISIVIIILLSNKIKGTILYPIKNFKDQITKMEARNALSYVHVDGADEISSLAKTFNHMIDSIKVQKRENQNLKLVSITDNLTTLYNHRYFFEYIKIKAEEENKNLSVFFCDIDFFKLINDYYGHTTGDIVLREMAFIIKKVLGDNGHAFRYGGEEFTALIENCDNDKAYDIAERIRLGIFNSDEIQRYSCHIPITISIGIANYNADGPFNISEIVKRADEALYYAKKNGRNQCCIYTPEINELLDNDIDELSREDTFLNSVFALSAAIDAKDAYTEKHSRSVAKYALMIGEELHLSNREKYYLKIGGLLHDCGKIGVPDYIINKPGKLTDEEWGVMKSHTIIGSDIVKYIITEQEVEACIRYHHERWDGNGYPEGLKGEAIPYFSRIICVADAYHAMTSNRSYRKGMSKEQAIEQLRKNRDTQFNSEIVDAFINAMERVKYS